MKTGFYSYIILLLSSFFCFQANAQTIHQVYVPQTIKVNHETLLLNGAGIRHKFLLDIYVGALYLAEKSSDASQVISNKTSKCITLHLLQNLSEGTFASNIEIGIANNVSEKELEDLQPEITIFKSFFEDADKGSFVMFSFLDDDTTELFINQKKKGSLQGQAFQQALLKAWLGNVPADGGLKEAMMGAH